MFIDGLLARYLELVHEYARLRALLAADTAALFGHLARANFAAERGLRYGPTHFDGRMQATARLAVGTRDGGEALGAERALPTFAIRRGSPDEGWDEMGSDEGENEDDDKDKRGDREDEKKDDDKANKDNEEEEKKDGDKTKVNDDDNDNTKKSKNHDPLRWFGVLTPLALRQAQQAAVHAVDAVVPQLAAVDAEMAALEIAVRRARKRRAKEQGAEAKSKEAKNAEAQEEVQAVDQSRNMIYSV